MAKVQSETASEGAPRFVVTITAPAGPRRRAGIAFGKEPVHLREDQFDRDKREALSNDPLLVIRPYAEPEAEAQTE